jgi:hypothetical protein
MDELESTLLDQCRAITQNTLWNSPNPKGLDEMFDSSEREALAQKYFEHCLLILRVGVYPDPGKDPRVVLRAVKYLGSFAIPPMGSRVTWFSEGLHVLLNLAWPISGTPVGGEPFFDDIRHGLDEAEANAGVGL